MNIAARFAPVTPSERRETGARHRLHLQSRLAPPTVGPDDTRVLNLSRTGMLLKTDHTFEVGETLVVSIDSVGDCPASVVWANDNLYGCRFDTPLGKSALSAAMLRSVPADDPTQEYPGEGPGERIARLRKSLRMTQGDLARAIGVSKTTIWKWENGAARPRKAMKAKLDLLLGNDQPQIVRPAPAAGPAYEQPVQPEPEPENGPIKQAESIEAVIASCKERIAKAAGTSPANITIRIEI